MHQKGMALVAAALVTLLSGCSAPASDEPAPESVTVITDPTQGRMDATASPHLHDYWGSSDRKTIVDATVPVGTLTFGNPGSTSVAVFLPDAETVVPQGTATVEVTVSWVAQESLGPAGSQYEEAHLGIRTAADREPRDLGPVTNGQTVVFTSANELNDLPHQVLSSWEFHWILQPVAMPVLTSLVAFQGTVSVKAVAVRGLEIPLYPGHPDQWGGRTQFALFQAEGTSVANGNPMGDGTMCFGGCPPRLVPGDGVVVPIDASHIEVVLERGESLPARMGVAYHTAVSRDWQVAVATVDEPTRRVYRIEVLDGGDGAYAQQSNWEFQLFNEEPVEHGPAAEAYKVSATVFKAL